MVKNRIEYRFGEFVDFAGRQRKYVVAAVSELLDDKHYVAINVCGLIKIQDPVCKRVSLGFAICSPEDKWDEELGKKIALGKAIKRPSRVLYASHAGMINTDVVNALINQEMKFIEKAPSTVFKGYETAEKKWFESKNHNMREINNC